MKEELTTALSLIVGLSLKLGHSKINALPGLHVLEIDADWTARINGHREKCDGVPGFHALIEYKGDPYGIISPRNGTMLADGEDMLIAALEKRLSEPLTPGEPV